ncbi:MAG: hypothetical protein LBG08_02620, partial [Spirochaetaceae bacterium]|nr:hypothetical protein [Spirochaetaceae bacterium]
SFWNSFLGFKRKTGAFDRFFQEPVPKPCALAHSKLVLEQAQMPKRPVLVSVIRLKGAEL